MMENNLCRLCGRTENSALDIFDTVDVREGVDIRINTVLRIVVRKDDPLPNTVCIICLAKLDYTYGFINDCLAAQVELRKNMLTDIENKQKIWQEILLTECRQLQSLHGVRIADPNLFPRNSHKQSQNKVQGKGSANLIQRVSTTEPGSVNYRKSVAKTMKCTSTQTEQMRELNDTSNALSTNFTDFAEEILKESPPLSRNLLNVSRKSTGQIGWKYVDKATCSQAKKRKLAEYLENENAKLLEQKEKQQQENTNSDSDNNHDNGYESLNMVQIDESKIFVGITLNRLNEDILQRYTLPPPNCEDMTMDEDVRNNNNTEEYYGDEGDAEHDNDTEMYDDNDGTTTYAHTGINESNARVEEVNDDSNDSGDVNTSVYNDYEAEKAKETQKYCRNDNNDGSNANSGDCVSAISEHDNDYCQEGKDKEHDTDSTVCDNSCQKDNLSCHLPSAGSCDEEMHDVDSIRGNSDIGSTKHIGADDNVSYENEKRHNADHIDDHIVIIDDNSNSNTGDDDDADCCIVGESVNSALNVSMHECSINELINYVVEKTVSSVLENSDNTNQGIAQRDNEEVIVSVDVESTEKSEHAADNKSHYVLKELLSSSPSVSSAEKMIIDDDSDECIVTHHH